MNLTRPLALSLVLGGVALAGCVSPSAGGQGPEPILPTARYSLQVEPGLDRIALAVHADGLSANQHSHLRGLVERFAASGAPALVIEAPAGADTTASQMAWSTRSALEGLGVPGSMIRVVGYAGPDARSPVLVGFETVRAVVPQCGVEWGNLSRNLDNRSTANFGCAVNANLAAQIANPRDIVEPRGMTSAEAGRRSVVFDNYRQGRATSAPQEQLLSSSGVAQAVQ